MNSAIYPGSFDPLTLGHLDLIKRASRTFNKVIVAVAHNSAKENFFDVHERVAMLQAAVRGIKNVEVDTFGGLVVDYARSKKIRVIIRGIRMISDFDYEFQMALTNRRLDGDIETVFLMPSEQYAFLSSTLIKEVACLDADISSFVPKHVEEKIRAKIQGRK